MHIHDQINAINRLITDLYKRDCTVKIDTFGSVPQISLKIMKPIFGDEVTQTLKEDEIPF